MTWLVEDPLPIVLAGIAAEVVLLVILFQTGRGLVMLGMLGVLMVTGLLLAIEWLVVTDRERVEGALYGIASALERHDTEGVLSRIASDATELRGEIEARLARHQIAEARIGGHAEVTFNRLTNPPSATARFFARFKLRGGGGDLPDGNFAGRFTVRLVEEEGQWKVAGYQTR
ncbi:MAG: hypothetical protein ACC645_01515 [Pirellulales bacterium]